MTPSDQEPDASPGPDYSVDPVPRVPHRSPWKFTLPALVRIAFFGTLLAAVLMVRESCASGVAGFVGGFDEAPDAAPAEPAVEYKRLTEDEIKRRFGGDNDAAAKTD